MQLDGLTKAYTLTAIEVSPAKLLLDPRNPRLITESSQDRSYTLEEIQSTAVQEHVRNLVCGREHGVKRLVASIREMGFVGGLHEMIVKRVGSGASYLVVEGNRRTAALQQLLQEKDLLRPDVRRSIERIEVKQFTYRNSGQLTEADVIDALLGSIHIDGPKEWGALERAHYVHRNYLRVYGERRRFQYDALAARGVGATFKMSPQAVQKCLRVSRVYEQLRKAGVGVEPKHYTLIDLATKTRAVAAAYFELDADTCELSNAGVERFVELVLSSNAPVHNPKLFDHFVEVFTDGTQLELHEVSRGDADLTETVAAIRRRKERREFLSDLEDIKARIGNLYVESFRGTEGEKAVIQRIKHLVDTRLAPLARARR